MFEELVVMKFHLFSFMKSLTHLLESPHALRYIAEEEPKEKSGYS